MYNYRRTNQQKCKVISGRVTSQVPHVPRVFTLKRETGATIGFKMPVINHLNVSLSVRDSTETGGGTLVAILR
ncbi:hypothetical protein BH20ACI2_BH20ACI2_28480 [soil metagenome]